LEEAGPEVAGAEVVVLELLEQAAISRPIPAALMPRYPITHGEAPLEGHPPGVPAVHCTAFQAQAGWVRSYP